MLSIVGAIRAARTHERWGVLVLEGVAGITASAVAVVLPIATTLTLVAVVTAWALITGALEIVAAIKLRRLIANEWRLALSGVVSLTAGALLIAMPFVGAIAIALVIGACAFVFGILLMHSRSGARGCGIQSRIQTWALRIGNSTALRSSSELLNEVDL
jgi:uncharacterized membrane protein HdeD (DUF308 family)